MKQALLDSKNNVMSTIGMAKSFQDILGERIYLATIDDKGFGSKVEVDITSDLEVKIIGE